MMDMIRAALASLRRSPGTSLIAFMLLLIGTTSTLVSLTILDAVDRGGFRFDDLDRLKTVWAMQTNGQRQRLGWRNFEIWHERSRSFEWLAAMDPVSVTVHSDGAVEQLSAARVSENLLASAGANLTEGRSFNREDREKQHAVIVISRRWSEATFGTTPVVGREIVVDGRSHAIIGVVDAFPLPSHDTSIWLPAWSDPEWMEVRERGGIDSWYVVGLLGEGQSSEAAASELRALSAGGGATEEIRFAIDPLPWLTTSPQIRRAAIIVLGAALVLLLISSANVAKLFHLRIRNNWSGLAVRLAVGASPRRLVMQMVTESLLVTAAAVAVSIAIAPVLLERIAFFWPGLSLVRVVPEPRLVLMATGAALAAVISGVSLSALALRRIAIAEVLRGQTRVTPSSRFLEVLATLQIGLAVLLLGSGGLLLRSGWQITSVDAGYDSDSVALIHLSLNRDRTEADRAAFHRALLERLDRLPGADGVALIEDFFTGDGRSQTIRTSEGDHVIVPMALDAVSPGFFRMMRMPLVTGRAFEVDDDEHAPPIAMVNRTMERSLGGGAVGRRIRIGEDDGWLTVVGVVEDARRAGRDREAIAQVFRPIAQRPSRNVNLLIRARGPIDIVVSDARTIIDSLDPGIPLYNATTLAEAETRLSRWRSALLGTLASLALIGILLASIATWVVAREHVIARSLEMAVRLSLGADRSSITRLLVAGFARRAAFGLALGTASWLVAGRLMKPILFETRAHEPAVILAAITITIIFVIIATAPSLRRARTVNPATVLRR